MALLRRFQKRPTGSRSGAKYWAEMLEVIPSASETELSRYRKEANKLAAHLHRFELALAQRLGERTFAQLSPDAEWGYRAEPFALPMDPPAYAPVTNDTRLSRDVSAFTDDPDAVVSLRQIATGDSADQPFSVILDIERLGGTFFSLAIGLGEQAARSFTKNDLIGVHIDIGFEHPTTPLVRLNLRSGPNTERITRPFEPGKPVDFDLFYLEFDTARMSDAWVDIILSPQSNTRITLKDIAITRRPRAEI